MWTYRTRGRFRKGCKFGPVDGSSNGEFDFTQAEPGSIRDQNANQPEQNAAPLNRINCVDCGVGVCVILVLAALYVTVPAIIGARPGEVRKLTNLKLKFVWCPAGAFQMGSPTSDPDAGTGEQPQVQVALSRGFWIGQTEVTQSQWQALMESTPWTRDRPDPMLQHFNNGKIPLRPPQIDPEIPATAMSWHEAVEFCHRLTEQERWAGRLTSSQSFELPTEAQWEYACRAGSTTRYSFGDVAAELHDYGWWGGGSGRGGNAIFGLEHVGIKKPNAWGIQDMHGNALEWCRDDDLAPLPGGRDPLFRELAETTFSRRICRGGSWWCSAQGCRSAARGRADPSIGHIDIGLRVVLVMSGQ